MGYTVIGLVPLAFVCEFLDSTLGMGYGTTLTPLLLLIGFEPMQIIPAVLLSEFVTGLNAAGFHHSVRNANFSPGTTDSKVAAVLSSFAVVGTVAAVVLAIKLPGHILKLWIGGIVLAMGVIILVTMNSTPRFSWPRLMTVGAVASFNKGMSGGGYGPLVMGGQMLSGIGVRNAVGITSLSEGVTCLVGVVLYFFLRPAADWAIAPWIMAGAVLSVPFAAHTLKRVRETYLKIATGVLIIGLGVLTLVKALL